jgi:hypothetical protein
MKYTYYFAFIFSFFLFNSCDSTRKTSCAAYGSGGGNSGSGSGSGPVYSNSGAIDGIYITEHVSTKRMIPYEFVKEADNMFGSDEITNGNGINREEVNYKGILTASELNDLSKWEFWKDVDSNQLAVDKKTWDFDLKSRFSVLATNVEKCPLPNLTVKLMNGKTVLWEAVTDNRGLAQLWLTETLTGNLHIACYANNKLVKTIETAVPFEKGMNTVTIQEEVTTNDEIDIVFAVDATSSMDDEIEFLKEDLMGIISTVKTNFPTDDLRLGSVFYQCEGSGNDYVTVQSELSSDINKTLKFIKSKGATGGGEEVVDKALDVAINSLSWRPDSRSKLLVILLDEPPEANSATAKRMEQAYRDAAAKGIRIIPCLTSNSGYSTDRSLEYLMRTGAMSTNGTLIFLTDDSGVGGKHTIPFTDNYEVELFKDVLERTIIKYSEKVDCDPKPVVDGGDEDFIATNREDLVNQLMDSITQNPQELVVANALLPFTQFVSIEDLTLNKPLREIDTVQFLNHFNERVTELIVFPNPTAGDIQLKANAVMAEIEVFDFNGKLLMRMADVNSEEHRFDISAFPVGNYRLRCHFNEAVVESTIQKY